MAAASILALPLDMISGILQTLPTAEDLLSVACSHSLFHDTIKQNEDAICEAVSLNQVDRDILPCALAAYHVRSTPYVHTFIRDVFLEMHYRIFRLPNRGTANFKCHSSLRCALQISAMQKSVLHFGIRLADETVMRARLDLRLDRRGLRY